MKKKKKITKNIEKEEKKDDRGIEEIIKEGGLVSRIIIEIQGAPKQHVSNTMKLVINKLKTEEKVIGYSENDAEEMGDKGIFSAFTEFEIAFNDISSFMGFCFDYVPSSIEILEPKTFNFDSNIMSDLLNDLVAKIHHNGEAMRIVSAENKKLHYNVSVFLRNILIISMAQKERTLDELSKISGVKSNELEPILKQLVDRKELNFKDNKYSLVKKNG